MKTITTIVYTFDELGDTAKDRARDWYREGLFDDGYWYECAMEEAKTVGLKIKSFDINIGVEGSFMASAEETAHKIETDHGPSCDTFVDAKAYLVRRDTIVNGAEKDENGDFVDEYVLDNALDDIDEEFLHTLCEDYGIILRKEAEYIGSNESVDANIRSNEYTFTETGKREG
jgi:hypothetical protein